jgi:hypothetical protein
LGDNRVKRDQGSWVMPCSRSSSRGLRPAGSAIIGCDDLPRDIRPCLIEIPWELPASRSTGDLDAWADQHKARAGRPPKYMHGTLDVGVVTDAENESSTRFTRVRIYARLGRLSRRRTSRRRIAEIESAKRCSTNSAKHASVPDRKQRS